MTGKHIYCLNCFYNLYGLIEHRCPECGRHFDPENTKTFSHTPNPEHFSKIVKRVALAINETIQNITPVDPAAQREAHLRQRLDFLERTNQSLQSQIDTLLEMLERNGSLTSEEIMTIREPTTASGDEMFTQIVDDDVETEIENDASPELGAISDALKSRDL